MQQSYLTWLGWISNKDIYTRHTPQHRSFIMQLKPHISISWLIYLYIQHVVRWDMCHMFNMWWSQHLVGCVFHHGWRCNSLWVYCLKGKTKTNINIPTNSCISSDLSLLKSVLMWLTKQYSICYLCLCSFIHFDFFSLCTLLLKCYFHQYSTFSTLLSI